MTRTRRRLDDKLYPSALRGFRQPQQGRPLEAFRQARRTFIAGERIEIGALAESFGVNAATIFRWLGNRNQLLTEVLWSLCGPAWNQALQETGGSGAHRVTRVIHRWLDAILGTDFFRAFLIREESRALRLLTTGDGLHQQRVIDIFEALLLFEQDVAARQGKTLPLVMEPRDMAYAMCRVGEAFVYSDLIVDQPPDPDKAAVAIGALLGIRYVPRP